MSNKPIPNLAERQLHEMEAMPGIVWVAKNLTQNKSNITAIKQEHKCSNKMTQWHSAVFIDKCVAQSLSENLPPAADGNECKDPKPDIIHRVRNIVILSLK